MKNQTIRIPEELKMEIKRVGNAIGEKDQTVIRLSLKEGLVVLIKKFSSSEIRTEQKPAIMHRDGK